MITSTIETVPPWLFLEEDLVWTADDVSTEALVNVADVNEADVVVASTCPALVELELVAVVLENDVEILPRPLLLVVDELINAALEVTEELETLDATVALVEELTTGFVLSGPAATAEAARAAAACPPEP